MMNLKEIAKKDIEVRIAKEEINHEIFEVFNDYTEKNAIKCDSPPYTWDFDYVHKDSRDVDEIISIIFLDISGNIVLGISLVHFRHLFE